MDLYEKQWSPGYLNEAPDVIVDMKYIWRYGSSKGINK